MDERDKRRVGEQIDPGRRPKAPGRLEVLQRFLNTWNHEFPMDWDRLGTPAKARAWLGQKGLVSPGARVTATQAEGLRQLREAIRRLVLANHAPGPAPSVLSVIRRESRTAILKVAIDDAGSTTLEPATRGVEGAIAILLDILYEAQVTGVWPRLKGCRQCEYVFFDRSKNRSAAWCSMSICGNRTKNRAYRRRRNSSG